MQKEEPKNQATNLLIIIGRMGHGKSSFIKMLTDPIYHKQIEVGCGIFSITKAACKYPVKHGVFGNSETAFDPKKLQIIDTPGINSMKSLYQVVNSVNCLLKKEIGSNRSSFIIGIGYVINLGDGKEGNHKNESYLQMFYNLLKLRHKNKENLIFTVFTKWDKNADEYQQPEEKLKEYRDLVRQIGLPKAWESHVKWASEPKLDIQIYNEYIQDYPQLYNSQFGVLCQILNHNYQYKQSVDKYNLNLQLFEEESVKLFRNFIRNNYQSIKFHKKKSNKSDKSGSQASSDMGIRPQKSGSQLLNETYRQVVGQYKVENKPVDIQIRLKFERREVQQFSFLDKFLTFITLPFQILGEDFEIGSTISEFILKDRKVIREDESANNSSVQLYETIIFLLQNLIRDIFVQNVEIKCHKGYIKIIRECDQFRNIRKIQGGQEKTIKINQHITIPFDTPELTFKFKSDLPCRQQIIKVLEKKATELFGVQ